MNGKKAKQLRKLAKLKTEFLPDVHYEFENTKVDRKTRMMISGTRIIPAHLSTRGLYRQLKKEYKNVGNKC